MTIWIVIIEDRHADVDVLPFSSMPTAVQRARHEVPDARDVEEIELTEGMARDGWVLCLEYGLEGDSVRVVEREIDAPSRSLAPVNEILYDASIGRQADPVRGGPA